jgi:hypothetical protein
MKRKGQETLVSLFRLCNPKADRARVAQRLRSLMPLAFAVMTGCTTEETSRALGRTYTAVSPRFGAPTGNVNAATAKLQAAAGHSGSNFKPLYPISVATTPAPALAELSPSGRVEREPTSPAVSSHAATSSRADRDPSVKAAAEEASLSVPCPNVIPPPSGTYPIDLATALRLADVANPTIGAARAMILEALALQLTARSLLLPSLNSGVTYRGHNGILQRVSGKMIDESLQQLFVGAGVGPFGSSGTATLPGVNIFCQLTDAWFEPLAARQRVAGARFGAQATSYDILLDVAVLHLALLGNQSILELQRRSEADFYEVYRLTKNYADAGEGREADAHRALSQRKNWPSPRRNSPTASILTPRFGSSQSAARSFHWHSSRSTRRSEIWYKSRWSDGPTSPHGRPRSIKPRRAGKKKSAAHCFPRSG